jgi:WD40 repeat protein
VHRLRGHPSYLKGVAISPDGRLGLSVEAGYGTVCLWDLQAGRELRRFDDDSGWIDSVAFSPDGSYALTGGLCVMALWDVKTGRRVRTFQGDYEFAGVAFTPDGRHAVSACWTADGRENSVRLWELPKEVWRKPATPDAAPPEKKAGDRGADR